MNTSAVRYWVILGVALGGIYASFVVWRNLHADDRDRAHEPLTVATSTETSSEPPLTEFVLTDQAGQPFDSNSLRGKVWVASFFFINCPAKCWRQNQALAALQQTHPDSKVEFVSISCDPENDTPEALAKYAEHFKANPEHWKFLTGDLGLVCRIGKDMCKISVEKAGHSDRACVIDREGKLRGNFRLTEPGQVELLQKLLEKVEAEKAPEEPATATTTATQAS